jgi:hypothetical protein
VHKPSTRGLLEAIERMVEMTNMAIKNRVARRWVHVDLLIKLIMKKIVLHVKLRDSPLTNRCHRNKRMSGCLVSNMIKSLLIVMTILLLKTMSDKTLFKALNRTIRVSIDLVTPLTRDWNNRRRSWNKTPSVGTLKRSNLLSHSKLLFKISNNISIGGRLRKTDNRACGLISDKGRRNGR